MMNYYDRHSGASPRRRPGRNPEGRYLYCAKGDWTPAFAGVTNKVAGVTNEVAGVTKVAMVTNEVAGVTKVAMVTGKNAEMTRKGVPAP